MNNNCHPFYESRYFWNIRKFEQINMILDECRTANFINLSQRLNYVSDKLSTFIPKHQLFYEKYSLSKIFMVIIASFLLNCVHFLQQIPTFFVCMQFTNYYLSSLNKNSSSLLLKLWSATRVQDCQLYTSFCLSKNAGNCGVFFFQVVHY